MRSIVEVGSSVPAFLGKLWKLVNDSETDHLISWSPGGKTFFIKNQADFARSLLPMYYKHNNMASFIRQLNMYGFHKITSVENGGLRYEKDEIEFSHPCFMKGHAYLLEHIKRKIANPKSAVSEEVDKIMVKPELMTKVLAEVKQMKGKQESMDAKFSVMKQENEALWREVAVLRQKHIKQQQIVNNLIQFLMSLVQPSRSGNMSSHGVKRRYQLMINDAAHNLRFDQSPAKNPKLEAADLLEDLNEETLEDGPTIHELAHDDMIPSEETPSPADPSNYVTIEIPSMSPSQRSGSGSAVPMQYHVTLEDAEDPETAAQLVNPYQINSNDQLLAATSPTPIVTSPSPDPTFGNLAAPAAPSASPKHRTAPQLSQMLSPSQYTISPAPDMRLPADIFASDDSVSDAMPDAAQPAPNIDSLVSTDVVLNMSDDLNAYHGMFIAPQGLKLEKNLEPCQRADKKGSNAKQSVNNINLANIKTELQDWNIDDGNMTLATVNNNGNRNRVPSVNRRDIFNNNEDRSAKFGANKNKNDVDDHLETMQSDLESLRDLLRSDSYSLDANTLLGVSNKHSYLFGQEDPFYGLNFNTMDDRTKANPNGQGTNQLMSYTGTVPDFGDFSLTEDAEASQDDTLADSLLNDSSALNTPQVLLQSPFCPPAPK